MARAWKSFWALPALMIVAALAVLALAIMADRAGLSEWLFARDLHLVETGDGFRETVGTIAALNGAFVTLYFSITLLVLTIAASNLGVRLIDRWIARPFVRATLGLLLAATASSLLLLMVGDLEGEGASLLHGSLILIALLMLVELVWLAVALHDLGRAIFVDTAIAAIEQDGCRDAEDHVRAVAAPLWQAEQPVLALRSGYVLSVDIESIAKLAKDDRNAFRLVRAAGDHVLPGEPLAFAREPLTPDEIEKVCRAFTTGPTRADQEGLSYRARLLVEMAARALSPAVNDFYTARACVDALVVLMLRHRARLTSDGELLEDRPGIYCPAATFERIFARPVDALRQAAAPYPAIAIRFIERTAAAAALSADPAFHARMRHFSAQMRAHAVERAEFGDDRNDIDNSFRAAFPG